MGGRHLGPESQKCYLLGGQGWGVSNKVSERPGGADCTGWCQPRCGGSVGRTECCVQTCTQSLQWGAEAGLLRCLWGRARAGSGPAAPQGSLRILPTAHSSAAQASLAQCRGHGGCRTGQEEAPALPGSSLQGPGTRGAASGLQGRDSPKRSES